ncbi:MAG: hypothetical protein WBA77_16025 [Microcoleaceae cyanobacterium]
MKPSISFKKVQEFIKIAAINLIILFLCLEGGSLLLFYLKNKQLFYTQKSSENYQELGINLEGVRLGESIVERLHPFFGYIQRPGPDFRPNFKTNNYGFISPYDYPFTNTSENQYIVGIFGGSVASNYSIYEIQNKILETRLKQIPALKNKEIIILSFATGGYKQPQQLLILNYMLSMGQKFDLVINIDGFNEVALSRVNDKYQLNFTMPSANHILALTQLADSSLSDKALEALLKIKQTKPKIEPAIEQLQNCGLASCYAFKSLQLQLLLKDYRTQIQRFERYRTKSDGKGIEDSILYFYVQRQPLEIEQLFQKIINNWVETSKLMRDTLAAENIPYFHILQPNQYHQTQRVFTEAEQQIAWSEDSPYDKAIRKAYPLLIENINLLKQDNINILNAVNIFDNTSDIVYIDDCCHYNPTGEQIFSDAIAEFIIPTIETN